MGILGWNYISRLALVHYLWDTSHIGDDNGLVKAVCHLHDTALCCGLIGQYNYIAGGEILLYLVIGDIAVNYFDIAFCSAIFDELHVAFLVVAEFSHYPKLDIRIVLHYLGHCLDDMSKSLILADKAEKEQYLLLGSYACLLSALFLCKVVEVVLIVYGQVCRLEYGLALYLLEVLGV